MLFETFDDGILKGHTENFIEVIAKSESDLRGLILPVKITSADESACYGEIINL